MHRRSTGERCRAPVLLLLRLELELQPQKCHRFFGTHSDARQTRDHLAGDLFGEARHDVERLGGAPHAARRKLVARDMSRPAPLRVEQIGRVWREWPSVRERVPRLGGIGLGVGQARWGRRVLACPAMASLLSRTGVRRVLVLPLFLVGLGACRLLLGIEDPGPALGEADAAPNDGALPTDGPTAPDVLTDARVDIDDGGLDGGGPCEEVVSESFTGDASYTSTTDVDGGLKLRDAGMVVTVGSGTGQASAAYIKFELIRPKWNTAFLDVDLTFDLVGTSSLTVNDRLILLQNPDQPKVELGLERTTDGNATTFHLIDTPRTPLPLTPTKRVTLRYVVPSDVGDASVGRTVVTGANTFTYVNPTALKPGRLELSIGALGVALPPPPALSYTIHKVTLCVQ